LPKLPRRISGPVVARGGGVSLPLPGFAPPSLPLRERVPQPRVRPARPQRVPRDRQLTRRALRGVLSVPDLPLLDRIVRGRTWIALLGVMLAGIVTMQVEVLKLGREIGAASGQATVLQSRNELLRASVAGLSNVQRIEQLAVQQGMVMPPPMGVGFVPSGGAGGETALIQRALSNIHTPSPSSFGTQSTSNGGLTVAAGTTTAVAH
jgi:cell division protein FtsL